VFRHDDQHVLLHLSKFFVDVVDSSDQAGQIRSVDVSWLAHREAAAEAADGARASGHPFTQNLDTQLDVAELSVQSGRDGFDGDGIATAFGQLVELVSGLSDASDTVTQKLKNWRWRVTKVVFDDRFCTFGFTLDVVRMIVDVSVMTCLCCCPRQNDCKAEDQSVGECCFCSFHLLLLAVFGCWRCQVP